VRYLPVSNCLSGDTRILAIDGTTTELRALRVGDLIYGTARETDGRRRLVRTRVVAHWQTVKRAMRITLGESNTIVASPEHRFLSNGNGWKPVSDLAVGDQLFGPQRRGVAPAPRARDTENALPVFVRPLASADEARPPIRYARACNTALAADAHLSGSRPMPRAPWQCNETFFAPAERYSIRAIEDLGFDLLMFDITTGTGDFIANGVVSHNCNAR